MWQVSKIETSMGLATNQKVNVVVTMNAPIEFTTYVFSVVTVALVLVWALVNPLPAITTPGSLREGSSQLPAKQEVASTWNESGDNPSQLHRQQQRDLCQVIGETNKTFKLQKNPQQCVVKHQHDDRYGVQLLSHFQETPTSTSGTDNNSMGSWCLKTWVLVLLCH